jgi:hypothetical protein
MILLGGLDAPDVERGRVDTLVCVARIICHCTVFDKSDQVFSTFSQMDVWERSKQYRL